MWPDMPQARQVPACRDLCHCPAEPGGCRRSALGACLDEGDPGVTNCWRFDRFWFKPGRQDDSDDLRSSAMTWCLRSGRCCWRVRTLCPAEPGESYRRRSPWPAGFRRRRRRGAGGSWRTRHSTGRVPRIPEPGGDLPARQPRRRLDRITHRPGGSQGRGPWNCRRGGREIRRSDRRFQSSYPVAISGGLRPRGRAWRHRATRAGIWFGVQRHVCGWRWCVRRRPGAETVPRRWTGPKYVAPRLQERGCRPLRQAASVLRRPLSTQCWWQPELFTNE